MTNQPRNRKSPRGKLEAIRRERWQGFRHV